MNCYAVILAVKAVAVVEDKLGFLMSIKYPSAGESDAYHSVYHDPIRAQQMIREWQSVYPNMKYYLASKKPTEVKVDQDKVTYVKFDDLYEYKEVTK